MDANFGKAKAVYLKQVYLAVSEYVEQQRQTLLHKLRTVIVWADLQKILQQLINNTVQSGFVCCSQGMHPAMQRPRHPERPDLNRDVQMIVLSTVVHGLLQGFQLGLVELRSTIHGACTIRGRTLGKHLLQ